MFKTLIAMATLLPALALATKPTAASKPAVAKPIAYEARVLGESPFPTAETQYKWTTPAEVKAGKARFASGKRYPSSQRAADEASMSPAFRR